MPILTKSTGDFRKDKAALNEKGERAPYAAHLNHETNEIEGPEDAFIFYGLPFQGNPVLDTRLDPRTNKDIPVEPFLDHSRISTEIGGVKVEWVEWDEETGCNVYRRVAADKTPEHAPVKKATK